MPLIPYVVEQTNRGERSYDIFSRLLNDRIIGEGSGRSKKRAEQAAAEQGIAWLEQRAK